MIKMKITIHKNLNIPETQVEIHCIEEDNEVRNIVLALKSIHTKLQCQKEGEVFQLNIRDVLYIEAVERKTFLYTQEEVYEINKRLYELEEDLKGKSFFRASKSILINLQKVSSLRPELGARLLLTMENQEKIVVSRKYAFSIKKALGVS